MKLQANRHARYSEACSFAEQERRRRAAKIILVNEELNPYASPTNPEESETFELQRDIVLQYANNEMLQTFAALSTYGNSVIRGFCVIGLIAVGFFVGAWLGRFVESLPLSDAGIEAVRGGIILVCVFGAAALQFLFINRFLAGRERRRIGRHPIVGVLGDWQLAVDHEHVTIENRGGRQSWPLAAIRYEINDFNRPILWLEPDLPIALPYAAGDTEHYSRRADAVLRDRLGLPPRD